MLAHSDLKRIQSIAGHPTEQKSASPSRDSLLRGLSERKISGWTNTIHADFVNRNRKREQEQAAAEAVQLRLDAESAVAALEERNRIIEKANTQIFRESDRMKSFQSAMMLSDVLSEREQQLKVKEQLRILEEIRNRKYAELVKHNNHSMVERERQEEGDRLMKRIETRRIQLEQLEEMKSRRKDELQQEKAEAELLAEHNKRSVEEDIKLEQARKLQAIQAQKESRIAHEYMEEIRRNERRRESLTDAAIVKFAQKKERMFEQINERRKDIFANRLRVRQSLIDEECERLAVSDKQEASRVATHVTALERIQDRKETEEADRRRQRNMEIVESHRAQVAAKEQQRLLDIAEARRAATIGIKISAQMQLEEKRRSDVRKNALKDLKQDLTVQIKEKQARKARDLNRARASRNLAEEAVRSDEDAFWCHAESIIREYAEEGKNVIPLVNSLKHGTGFRI